MSCCVLSSSFCLCFACRQSKRPGVTERILSFILSVALRNGKECVVNSKQTHFPKLSESAVALSI